MFTGISFFFIDFFFYLKLTLIFNYIVQKFTDIKLHSLKIYGYIKMRIIFYNII